MASKQFRKDHGPETSDQDLILPSPQEPEPAHLRRESLEDRRQSSIATVSDHDDDSSGDEREATELRSVERPPARPRLSRVLSPGKPLKHWYDPVKRYWRHEIRISVPHVDCRDHLANERTFLGYLRTSVILSMIGIFIAQFYRLQHSAEPSKVFGYFVVGKPLSIIFQAAALITVLLGGLRFWRQQGAMARGKVHARGFELLVIGGGVLLLLVVLFCLHLALEVITEDRPWFSE